MIFSNQNEQDEPPVNILRAINKDHQGGLMLSNHKVEKPSIEQFQSNQSFNPTHQARRLDASNQFENILSSNQDFLSSQSQ